MKKKSDDISSLAMKGNPEHHREMSERIERQGTAHISSFAVMQAPPSNMRFLSIRRRS